MVMKIPPAPPLPSRADRLLRMRCLEVIARVTKPTDYPNTMHLKEAAERLLEWVNEDDDED